MSNIIPPLVSSSPPPMVAGEPDDIDEDEFGDFTAAGDFSFDGYSLPSTPQHVPYTYTTTSISTSTFNNSSPSRPVQTNSTTTSPKNTKMKIDTILSETITFNGQIEKVNSDQVTQTKTETNKLSEINNSKHIFCDIKTDVHKPDTINIRNSPQHETDISTFTTFVQNTDSDFDENIVHTTIDEPMMARMEEDYCDRRKTIIEDEFGDFTSSTCEHKDLLCKKLSVNDGNLEICESREEFGAFASNFIDDVEIVKYEVCADNMNENIVINSKHSLTLESDSQEIGCINNLTNEIDYAATKHNLFTLDEIQDDFTEFQTNIDTQTANLDTFRHSDLKIPEVHDFEMITSEFTDTTNQILETQTLQSDNFGDFYSEAESITKPTIETTQEVSANSDANTTNKIIDNEPIQVSETDDFGDFNSSAISISADETKLPDSKTCTEPMVEDSLTANYEVIKSTEKSSCTEIFHDSDTNIGVFNSDVISETLHIKTQDTETSDFKNSAPELINDASESMEFVEERSETTSFGEVNKINLDCQVSETNNFGNCDIKKTTYEASETDNFGDFKSMDASKLNVTTIASASGTSELRDIKNNSATKINFEQSSKVSDTDDFGEYNSNKINFEDRMGGSEIDDFGDYESDKPAITDENLNKSNTNLEITEFGNSTSQIHNKNEPSIANFACDFRDFSNTVSETDTVLNQQSDFDDFGDFNDFATAEEQSVVVNQPNVLDAETLFKNVFSLEEQAELEFKCIDFMDNAVFHHVQDIENTNALSYHWANSESQKTLLRALNIDSRNILFGPRWNASMPRFAANLGLIPLEPVKTELPSVSQPLHPQLLQPTINVPVAQPAPLTCDVPAAKFDWTSSGLVNPLDYQPTESVKPETITEKPITFDQPILLPKELDSIPPNAQFDLTILTNYSHVTQSDNESVNSLKFIESPIDIENELKFDSDQSLDKSPTENIATNNDEFTNFQSSKPEIDNNWSNLVPFKMQLRETHISNELETLKNPQVFNIESLELKSTIVTPELSRRTIENDEDDFADFQMSLPPKEEKTKPVEVMTLEPLKPVVLETGVNNLPAQINWPEPGIVGDDITEFEFNYIPNELPVQDNSEIATIEVETKSEIKPETEIQKPEVVSVDVKQKKPQTEIEDDWSDFVCAQETAKDKSNLISQSSQIPNNNNNKSNKILNNFNLSQSQPFSQLSISNLQNTQLKHKVLPPAFVPTSSPSKVNPYAQLSTQQVAAQQIGYGYQPPYQIPVQTINTPFGGLPQTSLSSYTHYSVGQTELTVQNPFKSREIDQSSKHDFGMFNNSFPPEMKPMQSSSYNTPQAPESQYQNHTMQTVESTFLKMQPPITQFSTRSTQDDDDDWSDFVSSQPVPSNTLNGLSNTQTQAKVVNKQFPNSYNNKPTVWANNEQTPNIITNPVHYKVFQSYQASGSSQDSSKTQISNKSGNHSKSKSSISSISALPDLDFIAPKNKFFSKK